MIVVGAFFVAFTLFFAVMGLSRPHWAFALIVFLFPLKQVLQSYIPQLISFNASINIFIALAGGFAALARIQRDGLDVRSYFNPVTYSTFALYGMIFLGILYTPAPEYSRSTLYGAIPYHILFLIVTPLLIRNLEEFRLSIMPVVVGGIIVGIGYFTNPKGAYQGGRFVLDLGQAFGTSEYIGNPLAIADMGGTIAVFAALMVVENGKRLATLVRVGGIIAGLGMAVASGSRGQVLAAVFTSVLLYPLASKIKNPTQFFGTLAGLCVLGGVLFGVFKFFSGGDAATRWSTTPMTGQGSGVDDRFNRIVVSFNSYISSPGNWFQGLGTNSYAVYASSAEEGTYPHNLVIEVLCDYGIIGFTFFLISMGFTVVYGRRLWTQYREDSVRRSTVVVIVGLCLFMFIVSLKQGTLVGMAVPFWGMLMLARIATEESRKFAAAAREADLAHEWGDPQLAAQYDQSSVQDLHPDSPHRHHA